MRNTKHKTILIAGFAFLLFEIISLYLFSIQDQKTQETLSDSAKEMRVQDNPTYVPLPTVSSDNSRKTNISLEDTSSWQEVSYKNITFKIPLDYRKEIWENGDLFIYQGNDSVGRTSIIVENFNGGSRRQWYLNRMKKGLDEYELSKIQFQEIKIGDIEALDVINKGGVGNYTSPTLVAEGSVIVVVSYSNFDRSSRDEFIDTLISTIRFN